MGRAAAAQAAGIDGYHADPSAVREAAASSDEAGDGTDVWTFGAQPTQAEEDEKLFSRIKAVLPATLFLLKRFTPI